MSTGVFLPAPCTSFRGENQCSQYDTQGLPGSGFRGVLLNLLGEQW